MDDIISDAAALGKKIAEHPKMTQFVAAVKAVQEDTVANGLLKDYREFSQQIEAKSRDGKPIEVEEKHKLADLESKVAKNDKIKAMIRGEADYLDLMRKINDAIDAAAAQAHQ